MFRITQFMQEVLDPKPLGPKRNPPGPVVIWNLIRRCNLTCKHCYAISADKDFPNELDTAQVFEVMDNLKQFRVPVLILSGGEPLMRPDIFEIAHRAKAMGFYTALSTNGTLIDEANIDRIAEVGFDYLGISIDGIEQTHDKFRRKEGSYQASMHGLRLCRDRDIKVGLRFTMTQDNAPELPQLLELMDRESINSTSPISTMPVAVTRTARPTCSCRPPAGPWSCCSNVHWPMYRRGSTPSSSPVTTMPTGSFCCTG